jgi:predicted outer membrane repeat protein
MYNFQSSPVIRNCSFISNASDLTSAGYGGAIANVQSSPDISYCTFTGNDSLHGGAISNENSSPAISRCDFIGNKNSVQTSDSGSGAMYNFSGGSPQITNCLFKDNESQGFAGAIANLYSSPSFVSCIFSGNTSGKWGGGMFVSNSTVSLVNCLFYNNNCLNSGGAIDMDSSTVTAINCTFSNNTCTDNGGAIACYSTGGNLELYNTILWDNHSSCYQGNLIFVHKDSDAAVSLYNSAYTDAPGDITFETGSSGTINSFICVTNSDPAFENVSAGNYKLQTGSPCFNKGNKSYLPAGITADLGGQTRVVGADIDIGAYELQ